MKIFKITLVVSLFIATLASCTEQDLNEDDVLVNKNESVYFTGGDVQD